MFLYIQSTISLIIVTFATLLISAISSLPQTSLKINSGNLICTVYIHLITFKDVWLWEKLIDDNKDTSVLCLYTSANRSIPPPDVSFLELCTVNILVSTEFPYNLLNDNIHSARPAPHSSFIIAYSNGCSYHNFNRVVNWRPLIFYYFSNCSSVSENIFPNGFVNYIDSASDYASGFYLRSGEKYSLIRGEVPRQNLHHIPHYLLVSQRGSDKYWYAKDPKSMQTVCQQFKAIKAYYGVCRPAIFLLSLLQSKFNLTLTWDFKLGKRSAGSVLPSAIMEYTSFQGIMQFTRSLYVSDERSVKLFYCLPRQKTFLFTMTALISPFDRYLWLITFFAIYVVICFRKFSIDDRELSENILYTFRLLLEQDIQLKSIYAVFICTSFFVLHSSFRMRLTSNLVVPEKVKPVTSLKVLNQKGFRYIYDDDMASSINAIWNKSNLAGLIPNTTYTSYRLLTYSQNAIRSLHEKAVRISSVYSAKTRVVLGILDNLMKNASCFAAEEILWVFWESYAFYHPWGANFSRFTQQAHENGLMQLSRQIFGNYFMIRHHKVHKRLQTDRGQNDDENDKSFIKFNEAKPMFVVFLICTFGASGVFVARELVFRHLLLHLSFIIRSFQNMKTIICTCVLKCVSDKDPNVVKLFDELRLQ